jgi:glyoxylase-like metal-dependent hydrolase (beta-lactamase superfamily II)
MRAGAYALKGLRVRILREGHIVREGGKVVDASSTVTLIESGPQFIVVDTGSIAELEGLKRAVKGASLRPDCVDTVANTHLHMDHCGGNDLFRKAVFKAHGLENPPLGTVRVNEGDMMADKVSVMETPGHTAGSVTILVEAERRYAICGDALPTKADYDARMPPAVHVDRHLAIQSMNRILTWADVVIPGHDAPFDVVRKK